MLQESDFVPDADHPLWLRDALAEQVPLPRSLSVGRGAWHRPARMSHFWRENNEVIYILTRSRGTTGLVWVQRLTQAGHRVMPLARQFLRSPSFQPTHEVVRMITIVTGKHVTGRRTISEVQGAFSMHSLALPEPEVGCLLRSQLAPKHFAAMGLTHILLAHPACPERHGHLVLGTGDLDMRNRDEPIDRGGENPGVAFVAWEHACPLLLAAS